MSNPLEEPNQGNENKEKGGKYLVARKKDGSISKVISGPYYGEGGISDDDEKKAEAFLEEGEVVIITSASILKNKGLLNEEN